MKLSDFDFTLPPEQIALHPSARRDHSRLCVLDRRTGVRAHRRFDDLPTYLRAGDALVLNETRVRLGRLRGTRATGGRVELLITAPHPDGDWIAMAKPGRRLADGERIALERGTVEILATMPDGQRRIRLLDARGEVADPDDVGEPALPPYIRREPEPEDRRRYQTVFARETGAVAAPTAGLHFTEPLLDAMSDAGVRIVRLVLHVGVGTFKPVTVDDVASHEMDAEFYRYPAAAAETLDDVRARGGRVIAVGTTSARVLETLGPGAPPGEGWTSLFIHDPYAFRAIDGLVTNFHLPRSTLLMLVSALAGREAVLGAYREARDLGYRFYSYGDAMLIL